MSGQKTAPEKLVMLCRELERENAELKAEILRAELLVLQGSSGFEKENANLKMQVEDLSLQIAFLRKQVVEARIETRKERMKWQTGCAINTSKKGEV
jgi:hypothetical protein